MKVSGWGLLDTLKPGPVWHEHAFPVHSLWYSLCITLALVQVCVPALTSQIMLLSVPSILVSSPSHHSSY